jgi:hypothetical protein
MQRIHTLWAAVFIFLVTCSVMFSTVAFAVKDPS